MEMPLNLIMFFIWSCNSHTLCVYCISLSQQVLEMQQEAEDAETQTERWTPLIESIKKEAEEAAVAKVEEK